MERAGLKIVILLIAISLILWVVDSKISLILLVFAVFLAYFYRDPERDIGEGVVSPADGKIVDISDRRVEIFMGIFDCHVNRSPCDGVVEKIEHSGGRFLPAFLKESVKNEKNRILIKSENGMFVVEQIAGIFARRIICYLKEGERIKKGQRIGMIVFGSRVALEVPEGYRFTVRKGERVKAGQTVAVRYEETH